MILFMINRYEESGCVKENSEADIALLLDCTQNAARMGHRDGQASVIDMMLDFGLIPDFQVMYWVAIACSVPTFRRCASLVKDDLSLLSSILPHALERGMGGNFMHLADEYDVSLPVFITSAKGFKTVSQEGATMYYHPDEVGDTGELVDRVRGAVLRIWTKMGVLDDAIRECKRMKEGASFEAEWDVAIHVLETHKQSIN